MYRKIVKFHGKKIALFTIKHTVIEHFLYAAKYYTNTGIQINKNTWSVKFDNGIYSYTFVLPKDFIRSFVNNEIQ